MTSGVVPTGHATGGHSSGSHETGADELRGVDAHASAATHTSSCNSGSAGGQAQPGAHGTEHDVDAVPHVRWHDAQMFQIRGAGHSTGVHVYGAHGGLEQEAGRGTQRPPSAAHGLPAQTSHAASGTHMASARTWPSGQPQPGLHAPRHGSAPHGRAHAQACQVWLPAHAVETGVVRDRQTAPVSNSTHSCPTSHTMVRQFAAHDDSAMQRPSLASQIGASAGQAHALTQLRGHGGGGKPGQACGQGMQLG